MDIKLSDHFSCGRLLRFVWPSVSMMIFTSVYIVVDGFFVSNFVGKEALAGVNFIYPFLQMIGCLGFLVGSGGGAIVAITLGEGKGKKANEIFSLFVYSSLALGLILTALGFILLRPVAVWMGAEGEMLKDALTYGRWFLFSMPMFILEHEFESFNSTAEKPKLGLIFTLSAGMTNIVLDALLVGVLGLGIDGAAAATAFCQIVGGLAPLIYYSRPNSSLLRLGRARWDGRAVLRCFTNGSSELMSNISMSLVGILYNLRLLRLAGEDGVAAYGAVMYVNMVFIAVFIGYSIGAAPLIGYHYGAGDRQELRSLLRKSLVILGVTQITMFILGETLSEGVARIFVGYDESLVAMTRHGFKLYSTMFLFSGYAIFGSAFFTALGDGLTSALISGLRTIVFEAASVMLLPLVLDLDGIWLSAPLAELLSVVMCAIFLIARRKKYEYI